MPKFPVTFGRRRSTVTDEDVRSSQVIEPSFRVLERPREGVNRSWDGGVKMLKPAGKPAAPEHGLHPDMSMDDNIFADLKNNRGSGSSNTTKTTSTDTSSRHSNVSTAPSSADMGSQEEWKAANKKSAGDSPLPPLPKSNSGGFLNRAGRTFSFGGQRKPLPTVASEPLPPPPPPHNHQQYATGRQEDSAGRPRGLTSSTSSTATPPKLDDQDFSMNMGETFGKMFSGSGFDKRASVATMRDDALKQGAASRSLTGNRVNQPSPITIDKSAKIESSPLSWSSHHSGDNLLGSSPNLRLPNADRPPPIPRQGSPLAYTDGKLADLESEDTSLLRDSLLASRSLGNASPANGSNPSGRFRRNEDSFAEQKRDQDDNLFDTGLAHSSRLAHRYVARAPSPPRNKVMTPAQFEQYRQDKERRDLTKDKVDKDRREKVADDEEDQYDDDEDETEKSKQAAKQRRKQEAHMAVYRQQMMKVTGESSGGPAPSRPSLQLSFSTPTLPNLGSATTPGPTKSEDEDEDEEVPLAILAAHGFPNKNRPPNRISGMASNPNMRASVIHQTTQPARPGSSMGEGSGARSRASHLPAFARNLPQDPFVGAGLVNTPARESLAFSGGSAAPSPQGALPPGGLVGVIANEERSRAARRGSPQIDKGLIANIPSNGQQGFDPVGGIPANMMYGMNGMNGFNAQGMMMPPQMPPMMLSAGEQAQIQMTQQMQQFMQMQMQLMQQMVNQNGGLPVPMGQLGVPQMPELASRHSFVGEPAMMDPPRLDVRARTMSMVQPSSASWIQPQGYAPSIRVQGAGYTPSIAPSERSNVGLPGRYRPVSQAPPPPPDHMRRVSTMSGGIMGWDEPPKAARDTSHNNNNNSNPSKLGSTSDDEDEEKAWEAMAAKREKKRSLWKSKKSFGVELGAMIS